MPLQKVNAYDWVKNPQRKVELLLSDAQFSLWLRSGTLFLLQSLYHRFLFGTWLSLRSDYRLHTSIQPRLGHHLELQVRFPYPWATCLFSVPSGIALTILHSFLPNISLSTSIPECRYLSTSWWSRLCGKLPWACPFSECTSSRVSQKIHSLKMAGLGKHLIPNSKHHYYLDYFFFLRTWPSKNFEIP